MYLFDRATLLLPKPLQPLAKAVYPAAAAIVAVGAQWAATGAFDRAELSTAVTGLGAALLTYLLPNQPSD